MIALSYCTIRREFILLQEAVTVEEEKTLGIQDTAAEQTHLATYSSPPSHDEKKQQELLQKVQEAKQQGQKLSSTHRPEKRKKEEDLSDIDLEAELLDWRAKSTKVAKTVNRKNP